ncbi:MAG: hypothetical protein ABIQ40_10570, partial [Bacteroidia bacterium]
QVKFELIRNQNAGFIASMAQSHIKTHGEIFFAGCLKHAEKISADFYLSENNRTKEKQEKNDSK